MKNFLYNILILGLTVTLLLTIPLAQAIGATPLRVEYKGKPGDIIKGQLSVMNSSNETKEIVVNKGDFLMNSETEEVEFFETPNGANIYSLQDWIIIPQDTFTVETYAKQVIPYEIHIPYDAEARGHYGSLFVQEEAVEKPEAIASAKVSLRIAHLILLEVEGKLTQDISLVDFKINGEKTMDGMAQFESVFFNNGNIHGAPQGIIEVTDVDGLSLNEVTLNEAKNNVLPNSKKTFKTDCDLNHVEPGVYRAKLQGFTEEGKEIAAEIVFEITEDGQYIMLGSSIGEGPEEELIPLRQAAEREVETLQILFIAVYAIILILGLTFLIKYPFFKKAQK